MRRQGFTLIEMLVVLAIIVLLLSLIFPVMLSAQERARQATCLNNQRNIAMAITAKAQDNSEMYPGQDMWTSIDFAPGALQCPTYREAVNEQQRQEAHDANNTNDYAYSAFLCDRAVGVVKDPTNELVTVDAANPTGKDMLVLQRPEEYGLARYFGIVYRHTNNIFFLPSEVAYRHDDAFIASFCDGHVARMHELPPLWVVTITNPALFRQEVLESSYPVCVWFYSHIARGPNSAYQDALADDFEHRLPFNFRGLIKFVYLDTYDYPYIAQQYNVSTQCLIMYKRGAPIWRYDPPPALNISHEEALKQLTDVREQLRAWMSK